MPRVAVSDVHGHIVKMRFAVSVRPPELRLGNDYICGNGQRASGRNADFLTERNVSEASFPHGADFMVAFVDQHGAEGHAGFGGVELRRKCLLAGHARDCGGIEDSHLAMPLDPDIVPDAHVPASDGGNPVPAHRSVKGRVVGSKNATVGSAAFQGVALGHTRVGRRKHCDFKQILFGEQGGDVETCIGERTLDASERSAIEHSFGLPVDAVEVESQALAVCAAPVAFRKSEAAAVHKG